MVRKNPNIQAHHRNEKLNWLKHLGKMQKYPKNQEIRKKIP